MNGQVGKMVVDKMPTKGYTNKRHLAKWWLMKCHVDKSVPDQMALDKIVVDERASW
jgi:hypothetical protein